MQDIQDIKNSIKSLNKDIEDYKRHIIRYQTDIHYANERLQSAREKKNVYMIKKYSEKINLAKFLLAPILSSLMDAEQERDMLQRLLLTPSPLPTSSPFQQSSSYNNNVNIYNDSNNDDNVSF